MRSGSTGQEMWAQATPLLTVHVQPWWQSLAYTLRYPALIQIQTHQYPAL